MPAALERGDNMLGVQTKWCGCDDGVQVAGFKQATMIAVDRCLFAGDFSRRREARLVNITQSGNADSGDAQEITHQLLPATAGADNSKPNMIGRRYRMLLADGDVLAAARE